MADTIRVVIADDHPLILTALGQVLSEHEGFSVVAHCASGRETLDAVRQHQPDILLLDLQMPDLDGLGVLRALQDTPPRPRVVLLTAQIDEDQLIEAMQLDVRGVVLKEMAPRLLVQCLRRVHEGGQWLEKDSAGRAMAKLVRKESRRRELEALLTPREIEVVRLVRRGFANREIAGSLGIAEGTVKVHLHNIYEKLNATRRTDVMAFADEYGLS
jgi:DNA-binding NarL/FixJ family response regulator